jgi:hypothetical protein
MGLVQAMSTTQEWVKEGMTEEEKNGFKVHALRCASFHIFEHESWRSAVIF